MQFEALVKPRGLSELQVKYREVFLSPLGRDVLADLMDKCHFGVTLDPDNKVQIGEYNVGVAILAMCGILYGNTKKDVIGALCSVTPAE